LPLSINYKKAELDKPLTAPKLTKDEKDYLDRLLRWKKQEKKAQLVFYHCCLFAGGIILVTTFILMLENLNDLTVYRIGIPGLLISIPFFIIYALGYQMVEHKNLIATILEKLKHKKNHNWDE
jgi:hypothetical protein